jgi:predicted Zn-dependent peptidase
MQFKFKTLPNGLTIVGEMNKLALSVGIGFFVRTGSRDETAEVSGVSHFLEHMVFKGTDKLSSSAVNEFFDRTGAKFNAFTSEENTVFYAAVLPEYLLDISSLWSQLMRPALRDDDFNIEKNVIKEEIAMYKDLPHFDVMDKARSLHFSPHACGNSVLGSDESITNLSAEQMRGYFQTRYAPNNMLVACAGNFDWDRLVADIENYCSSWQGTARPRNIEFASGSLKAAREEKSSLVREHICMVSPAVSAQDPARYAASLFSMVIGDDTGSRYFWELVDNALAETASMQFEAMDGVGALYSYIRCSPENAGKVSGVIDSIFASVAKDGVTESELQAAENKVLSALTLKNELPMGRLIDVGFNWTYLKQYRTIDQEIAAVKAVTLDQIRDFIASFKPGRFTRFALGPA